MLLARLRRLTDQELRALREWVGSAPLGRATRSSYAPHRREAWFRAAVHLGTGEVTAAPEPPGHVRDMFDEFLPGWGSLLLCGGDTTIGPHRDAAAFGRRAAMVNLGCSVYTWWLGQRVGGPCDGVQFEDGDAVLLDTKVLHASSPQPGRMCVTARTIVGGEQRGLFGARSI